jgi:hypothetical protein
MTCTDARAAMLVAERSELRGSGDSSLARHLGECESCRRLAAAIENETAMLAATLASRGGTRVAAKSVAGQRARLAVLVTALPIAATIALAAVLQRRDGVIDRNQGVSTQERIATNIVSVDVERGQTATVIRTRDPKVTIVWISPGGTQ